VCLTVGGVALARAAVRSITARDTSEDEFWLWRKLRVTGPKTTDILVERHRVRAELLAFSEGLSSRETKRSVIDSLSKRTRAADRVCRYVDDEVGKVALWVIIGFALVAAGVAGAIARI
jgi:hypothetical protein